MSLEELTDATLANMLEASHHQPVVIMCSQPWCGPCRIFKPTFEGLCKEYSTVRFAYLNCQNYPTLALQEGITAFPTFLLYQDGKVVHRLRGANLAELHNKISALMEEFVLDSAVEELRDNSREDLESVSNLLLRVATNILEQPLQEKFRKLRVENPLISEKLLPINGAVNCLFAMGFQEAGEYFEMPPTSLDKIRKIRGQIERLLDQVRKTDGGTVKEEKCGGPIPAPTSTLQTTSNNSSHHLLPNEAERRIATQISNHAHRMAMYESKSLQQLALRVIPLALLKTKAHTLASEKGCTEERALLLELTRWFKQDFFKWTDKPECSICSSGGDVHALGMTSPNAEEMEFDADRVELYKCGVCHSLIRFARYNAPQRLLESRRGRCGEWANCFTLILFATGFETRYVYDVTDHVWCEVWCPTESRWLHVDPCEAQVDKPLVYEQGWAKQLSHIFAFSSDDLQDVTWRYVAARSACRSRRRHIREEWLTALITQVRVELWRKRSISHERRGKLLSRQVSELVEFLCKPRNATVDELGGRQSGSADWRTQRGEIGQHADKLEKQPSEVVIRPLYAEKRVGQLLVRYDTAEDVYIRPILMPAESADIGKDAYTKDWQSLAHSWTKIGRKEEQDWAQAYLAREEGAKEKESGQLAWCLEAADLNSHVRFGRLEIRLLCNTFDDTAQICGAVIGDERHVVALTTSEGHANQLNVQSGAAAAQKLRGCRRLMLRVGFRGGKGSIAWQQAQLGRMSTKKLTPGDKECGLEMKADLVHFHNHIFRPSSADLDRGILQFSYNSFTDEYFRGAGADMNGMKGFTNWTYLNHNMEREVEPTAADASSSEPARVAFLQLRPGTSEGSLLWRVELMPLQRVSRVVVLIGGCVGESLQLLLCGAGGSQSQSIFKKTLRMGFNEVGEEDLSPDCSWLEISASLCCGSGRAAQLFRQSHASRRGTPSSSNLCALDVQVHFLQLDAPNCAASS